MPISAFRETIREFARENDLVTTRVAVDSAEGQGLIEAVTKAFQVSKDAARVRLLQQGILVEGGVGKTLFA
jgi:hypothetical protein